MLPSNLWDWVIKSTISWRYKWGNNLRYITSNVDIGDYARMSMSDECMKIILASFGLDGSYLKMNSANQNGEIEDDGL